ncbi:MAG: hypothetical protein ACOCVR_00795 [Myxococcota bacterium]
MALDTGPHEISVEVAFPYEEHRPSLVGIECGEEQIIFENPEQRLEFRHLPAGRCRVFGHWHSENEMATGGARVDIPADDSVKMEWRTEGLDQPHSSVD